MSLLILSIGFLILIILGMPLALSMILSSYGALVIGAFKLSIVPQTVIDGVSSFTLLAVPLFLFAGLIMNEGGVTDRIFDFAIKLVGHITGGLGHVNVIASIIFAGMSGSAAADAAGLGAIEIKAMKEGGYNEDFAAAVTCASSSIGPIIPPSIILVIYAVIANVSIAALFLGGFIPGFLMGISMMIVIYILAKTGKEPCPTTKKATLKEIFVSFYKSFLSLTAPVIILGGIFIGFVTPTEAGVLASVYAIILGFIYKELTFKKIYQVSKQTIKISSVMLFLFGTSSLYGWLLTVERVPTMLVNFTTSITTNSTITLLIMFLFILILGCLMNSSPALILATPVLLPVAKAVGVDAVFFGVFISVGLMIGVITPPVGVSLIAVNELVDVAYVKILKKVTYFYISLTAVVLFMIIFPQIVLFLPNLVLNR